MPIKRAGLRRPGEQLAGLDSASLESLLGHFQDALRRALGDLVIGLMHEDWLKARLRDRPKATTLSNHDQPVAANLSDRQFTAETVSQR